MPDYAEMYKTLFHAQSEAIRILQAAQQATEQLFVGAEPAEDGEAGEGRAERPSPAE